MSGSQTELNSSQLLNSNVSGNLESVSPLYAPDPLRKSVSLELLPTASDSDESSLISKTEGGMMTEGNFQGYLR